MQVRPVTKADRLAVALGIGISLVLLMLGAMGTGITIV